MTNIVAEFLLPTNNLTEDISFFTDILKMRMEMIYPADNPTVAAFSGHGLRIRIDKSAAIAPGQINLLCENPDDFADGTRSMTAPNGTKIEINYLNPPLIVPETQHNFVVRRLKDSAPWIIGRAGMYYRDLIPDRLGGSIIASHIRIPDGGPVPDMVHYHTVGFQLIFCYRGWVDLVYEDQGPPFRLKAGNCVIQPPEIRHRVLFASENIEVIEIGVPAEHVTTIDYEMTLPNDKSDPNREYSGQKFVHHRSEEAEWKKFRIPGFVSRDTSIAANTKNVAGVHVVKPNEEAVKMTWHDSDILFTFVMEGTMSLEIKGQKTSHLSPGDAFVVPPNLPTKYTNTDKELELLEVSLPGYFRTHII